MEPTNQPMSLENSTEELDIHYTISRPQGERISILETQQKSTDITLDDINKKLDDLLELKHKGMGALTLISILFASAAGLAGFLAAIVGVFKGG